MDITITSKYIIGDVNILEYLEKNESQDLFYIISRDYNFNERSYLPFSINKKPYVLLNTNIDCFSDELITKDEEIIYDDEEFISSIEKIYKSKFGEKSDRLSIFNYYLSKDDSFKILITLKVKKRGGRYFLVERDQDFRIITLYRFKEILNNLPIISIKPNENGQFKLLKPIIIYPTSLIIFSRTGLFCFDELNGINLQENLQFGVFKMIFNYGYNMKSSIFSHRDIVFIKVDYITPLDVINFRKISHESFDKLCNDFFKFEFEFFLDKMINEVLIFKMEKNLFLKGSLQFDEGVDDIKNDKYNISPCIIKNGDYLIENAIIYDVEKKNNDIFIEKTISKKNYRKMQIHKLLPNVEKITDEEALKNAQALLELEEREKEEKEEKKKLKKKKKQNKKKLNIKLIDEAKPEIKLIDEAKPDIKLVDDKKKLANSLALEAKKEYLKRLSKLNQLENQKIIAKKIMKEVENYWQNKYDGMNCEIGSIEYMRRVKEWDFSHFLPEIYCLPKDTLISLLAHKQAPPTISFQPKENLWLFEL